MIDDKINNGTFDVTNEAHGIKLGPQHAAGGAGSAPPPAGTSGGCC
jgi:Ras-related protein Rab-2A